MDGLYFGTVTSLLFDGGLEEEVLAVVRMWAWVEVGRGGGLVGNCFTGVLAAARRVGRGQRGTR